MLLAIIASSSLSQTIPHFGLVIAPLTFSVQILSLLVLLTLFVFVPVSIIGTLARLTGLRNERKGQGRGALLKSIASRFSVYLLYHLALFGLWFLLASMLIGNLYQQTSSDYPNTTQPRSSQLEEASPLANNRAEMYSSDGTSSGLRAPLPNEDRMVPSEKPLPPVIEEGACVNPSCEIAPYYESLEQHPYPPYDPIYTKSDILSTTYFLILIYPWLFVGYIILWTLFSTNLMYLIRNAQGKKPFKPTPGLYARLIIWNAILFGVIAGLVHHFALY